VHVQLHDVSATLVFEPDTQLMLLLKTGQTGCLDLLLEKHRASVVRFLFRMVQNQAVAEELAQDAFLRIYRSRATYQPTAKFTTWLFRIATHLALNWLRDCQRERNQVSLNSRLHRESERVRDTRPTADQQMIQQAIAGQVRRAVAELPTRQRAVVLLHKYEGLEYTQIAQALGCSRQAVKSLVFRAYATLRIRLAHLNAQGGRTPVCRSAAHPPS